MHRSNGISISVVGMVGMICAAEASPLHDAATSGNLPAVSKTLDDGVKVDSRDAAGKTALYYATAANHLEMIKLLLQRGANPDTLNRGAQGPIDAPIHIAARKGYLEAIRLLAAAKADLFLATIYVGAPLHEALKYKQGTTATLLKQLGAGSFKAPSIRGELAKANVKLGGLLSRTCNRCHALKKGGKPTGGYGNVFGPSLWNVVGRKKGGPPEANYSPALGAVEGTWTYDDLNSFIANPTAVVPGTSKWYLLDKQRLRAAVVAHLRTLSDNPAPLPE